MNTIKLNHSKNKLGNEDYYIIDLPIPTPINIKDKQYIESFFSNFNTEDIVIEINDHCVYLFLKSLDFSDFKHEANKHFLDKKIPIITQIISSIEGIKSYGIKDKKRIYTNYANERKVVNRKAKELKRSQYYYARNNSFSQINMEIPKQYINKIICDNSENILIKLPNNCIDLVFTSPPYNFGLNYSSGNDANHWEVYFKKLFSIFSECIRVLKYGGRIIVNLQPLFSDYVPSHHVVSNFFMSNKLIWKGEVIWEKNNYNCKYTAWGSWKSPSNPYLKYTWEFLEIFAKGSLKKEGIRINADITSEEFKKWVVSRWSIAPEKRMREFDHPAMFPEELALRVIKLFSFKNDIILDPFNGVGTTTLVAHTLGRRYLGIDISKKYCNSAKTRINEVLL